MSEMVVRGVERYSLSLVIKGVMKSRWEKFKPAIETA